MHLIGMYLAMPRELRKEADLPVDQKDYAKEIGISEVQFSRLSKDPYVEEIKENAFKYRIEGSVYKIIDTHIRQAEEGSQTSARLILDMGGYLKVKPDKTPPPKEWKVTFGPND